MGVEWDDGRQPQHTWMEAGSQVFSSGSFLFPSVRSFLAHPGQQAQCLALWVFGFLDETFLPNCVPAQFLKEKGPGGGMLQHSHHPTSRRFPCYLSISF